MSEWEALMFAVCTHPEDDTPRLVLADWLQENGDPERAEFIRLQIQLARGTYGPSERKALQRREQKLLTLHGPRWRLEVGGTDWPQPEFVRGFFEHATLGSGADLECALEAAPLQYVTIRGEVDLVAILRVPHVRRLKSLDLERAAVREPDLEAFAAGDWPEHPERLILPRGGELLDLRNLIVSRFGSWVSFGRW